MSAFSASINAYDVMDQVHITVRAWLQAEAQSEPIVLLLKGSTDIPGVGETDPVRWVRDALVGALEML